MEKLEFDCAIIGSGPGGYVAAIRAAQRGLKTALIEARETGGTCLNRGCIPSKGLIARADVLRKMRESHKYGVQAQGISFDYGQMNQGKNEDVHKIRRSLEGLIASNKISIFHGHGKFVSPNEIKTNGKDNVFIQAKFIIIATGSEPRELSLCPFNYTTVHDSTSFLNLTSLPKQLIVVGGGVIGCEFASLHRTLGVEVTILELLPTILPMEGKIVSDTLSAAFKKQGIKIETQVQIQSVATDEEGVIFSLADGRKFSADMALVSVGRKYNSDNLGLEKTGVIVEPNGTIPVSDTMQTNVPHIYAIGDVTGKWILAHVASHQGLIAADHLTGHSVQMNYQAIPSAIFTHPEIATVGLSLEKALDQGYSAITGKFPFQALGKSQASLDTEGFAQVVVDKDTGQILGAQVIGYGASNLIAEMGLAISNELTMESITETIHAHPTQAEAWAEAAFLAEGLPLHWPPKGLRS